MPQRAPSNVDSRLGSWLRINATSADLECEYSEASASSPPIYMPSLCFLPEMCGGVSKSALAACCSLLTSPPATLDQARKAIDRVLNGGTQTDQIPTLLTAVSKVEKAGRHLFQQARTGALMRLSLFLLSTLVYLFCPTKGTSPQHLVNISTPDGLKATKYLIIARGNMQLYEGKFDPRLWGLVSAIDIGTLIAEPKKRKNTLVVIVTFSMALTNVILVGTGKGYFRPTAMKLIRGPVQPCPVPTHATMAACQ
eukprot:gene5342-5371_t